MIKQIVLSYILALAGLTPLIANCRVSSFSVTIQSQGSCRYKAVANARAQDATFFSSVSACLGSNVPFGTGGCSYSGWATGYHAIYDSETKTFSHGDYIYANGQGQVSCTSDLPIQDGDSENIECETTSGGGDPIDEQCNLDLCDGPGNGGDFPYLTDSPYLVNAEEAVSSQELANCDPCNPTSPIVIDMLQDGIKLGGPESAIWYDLYGSGKLMLIQWVKEQGDEAFLAIDHNLNGEVDDGSELFGNGSRLFLHGNRLAPNGFVALAQYDDPDLGGNQDGFITDDDEVYDSLWLWVDSNADGLSDQSEMISLAQFGLTRLEVIPKEGSRRDFFGNRMPFWAWAFNDELLKLNQNSQFSMVDVFFRRLD